MNVCEYSEILYEKIRISPCTIVTNSINCVVLKPGAFKVSPRCGEHSFKCGEKSSKCREHSSKQKSNTKMQDYYKNFYQTLIFNVATISAIVVGVFQYAVRAFNENNGKEKVRNFILMVLKFGQSKLETPEVVTVEVNQPARKRRSSAT